MGCRSPDQLEIPARWRGGAVTAAPTSFLRNYHTRCAKRTNTKNLAPCPHTPSWLVRSSSLTRCHRATVVPGVAPSHTPFTKRREKNEAEDLQCSSAETRQANTLRRHLRPTDHRRGCCLNVPGGTVITSHTYSSTKHTTTDQTPPPPLSQ